MGVKTLAIRSMSHSDIPAVAALEAANQPRPWSASVFGEELARDDRVYVVAAAKDVVGFAGILVVGDEAHVTNILIDPEHRRLGIATKLMRRLVSEAVSRGARHLTLEVRTRNEPARNLYSKMGFAPVGVRPGYYDDDDALILWAHDIDEPRYLEALP